MQRCGHTCAGNEGYVFLSFFSVEWSERGKGRLMCGYRCGNSGLVCSQTSADYNAAIEYIDQMNQQGESKGMIGDAWLIGI